MDLLNSATSLLSTPIETASFDFMAKHSTDDSSKDQEKIGVTNR
jgi:hypothetical protein